MYNSYRDVEGLKYYIMSPEGGGMKKVYTSPRHNQKH